MGRRKDETKATELNPSPKLSALPCNNLQQFCDPHILRSQDFFSCAKYSISSAELWRAFEGEHSLPRRDWLAVPLG